MQPCQLRGCYHPKARTTERIKITQALPQSYEGQRVAQTGRYVCNAAVGSKLETSR
jgi:hypothetical protein